LGGGQKFIFAASERGQFKPKMQIFVGFYSIRTVMLSLNVFSREARKKWRFLDDLKQKLPKIPPEWGSSLSIRGGGWCGVQALVYVCA
jgi:hypothetical protein